MPSPQKPEKISVGSVGWDSSSQRFVVQLEARFGLATAGDNAGFTTSTSLVVRDADGNDVATLSSAGNPVSSDADNPGGGGLVPINPTFIAWDRNGGSFNGDGNVTASTSLQNPSGAAVDGASSELSVTIPITGGVD